LGVIQVPGNNRLLRANHYASRLEADFRAMRTIVALSGCAGFGIDVQSVVWAGGHARMAPDAKAVIEIHDPAAPFKKRPGGADAHAGGMLAMIAAQYGKVPPGVRERTLFHIFDPGPEYSQGNLIFRFAGCGACMATDAPAMIDDEAVSHDLLRAG
jgi:hypothetical protein